MAGIRYRLRAEWRTRWKAALALGLIAGIVGAVTLAAVAGVRRTRTAFDRLHDASRGWDGLVNPDNGAVALMKTLGLTRRQVSGVVAGRWAWGVLSNDLGAVAESVVPWALLLLGVPVLLLIANAVAFVPARAGTAARLRPATVLRSE